MANGKRVVLPLPIYVEDESSVSSADRDRILAVVPDGYTAQFGRAVPGSTRVLAIGGKPKFACDYALIPNTRIGSLAAAVEYALGLSDDPRGSTMADWLSDYLGPVVEITDKVYPRGDVDPGLSDEKPYREHLRQERNNGE